MKWIKLGTCTYAAPGPIKLHSFQPGQQYVYEQRGLLVFVVYPNYRDTTRFVEFTAEQFDQQFRKEDP